MKKERLMSQSEDYGYRALHVDNEGAVRRMTEKVFETQGECLEFIKASDYDRPLYEHIKINRTVYKLF